jgi:hypothetical protein
MNRVLRHVVLYRFKEAADKQTIRGIESGFAALAEKIEGIRDFEWGTNVSVEQKDGGFTHCFLVTFAGEQQRDAYLPHPAHQEFVALCSPHVEKVLVLDYWAS